MMTAIITSHLCAVSQPRGACTGAAASAIAGRGGPGSAGGAADVTGEAVTGAAMLIVCPLRAPRLPWLPRQRYARDPGAGRVGIYPLAAICRDVAGRWLQLAGFMSSFRR